MAPEPLKVTSPQASKVQQPPAEVAARLGLGMGMEMGVEAAHFGGHCHNLFIRLQVSNSVKSKRNETSEFGS